MKGTDKHEVSTDQHGLKEGFKEDPGLTRPGQRERLRRGKEKGWSTSRTREQDGATEQKVWNGGRRK